MKRLLAIVLGTLLLGGGWQAHADDRVLRVQAPSPAPQFVGTWRSGNFAFTFEGNGTYVYVGAMGGPAMRSQISEQGTYAVSGDQLIIQRRSGVVMTSQNYRRDLEPETTVYRWRMGNTPNGPAVELLFPNGQPQVFYRQ